MYIPHSQKSKSNFFASLSLCAIIFPVMLLFASCSDILEEDLADETIVLLAPPNNHVTTTATITFWWEELEGADEYNLQIVSPRFDSIIQLTIDSLVQNNKFTVTLSPGIYQWRLRGENSATTTDYVTRNLTIDTTTDLSQQIMVLVAPTNNLITNSFSIFFDWNALTNAEDYRFEIATPDFTNGANVLNINLGGDSINYTITAEGTYQWQVRAQNAFSNTAYTTRTFTVDTTSPNAPVLTSPNDQAIVNDTTTLTWTHDSDVTGDSLFVFTDSLLTNNSLTTYKITTTHTFIGTTNQDYFWYLRSVDHV